MTISAIDEWQEYFSKLTIDELISHIVLKFPNSPDELAALYGRFLDVAFIDPTESNHVRALSAAWAKALESVMEVTFVNYIDAFEAYRNHLMTLAMEHGYGTALYVARNDPYGMMRIFDGESQNEETLNRRTFLTSIAFGRKEDI